MATREGSPVIGTAELFENERVKVWDFVLEPGEAVPLHTHRRDHVIIVLEGSDLEVEYGDGAGSPIPPSRATCTGHASTGARRIRTTPATSVRRAIATSSSS